MPGGPACRRCARLTAVTPAVVLLGSAGVGDPSTAGGAAGAGDVADDRHAGTDGAAARPARPGGAPSAGRRPRRRRARRPSAPATRARRCGPVVVVIAAYNEAAGLPGRARPPARAVLGMHADVVVVDDGSTDGTADAVAGHDRGLPRRTRASTGGRARRCGWATGSPASTAPATSSPPTPTGSTTPTTSPSCSARCWPARPTSSPDRAGSAARRPGTGSGGSGCTCSPGRSARSPATGRPTRPSGCARCGRRSPAT